LPGHPCHGLVQAVIVTLFLFTSRKDTPLSGFLADSGYDGTTKIDLGNGYWAEVKNCLTSAEQGFVEALVGGTQRVDMGGKRQYAELNISGSRVELIVQSLAGWNLTEADGKTIWPLDAGGRFAGRGEKNPWPEGCPRRQSVDRLPAPVKDQIWQVCDELNGPREPGEAASFPEQGERGDQDGDGGAPGTAPVPEGTGAVEAAGADQG
jgi:hypothetical protein